ncbi:MAG TPA: pitrilysin family protein [Bryobacteraceae bacterium]|nr:pitrilysin family protein [Bryobacteraceae bacterium]
MIKRTFNRPLIRALVAVAVASAVMAQAPARKAQIPKGPRPEKFVYQPLNFKTPKPADYRKTLSNGLVVYIAEDHDIPWFSASMLLRTGPFLEPRDKLGLDRFTTTVVRTGGTTSMTGEQINDRMDFLAGSVTPASLSIHMRHLDEGLKIWMDLLSNPAFPEDKLRREKDLVLPSIRNRNKNVSQVTSNAYNRLVYGEDSPIAAEMTEAGVTSITRDDLVAWHKRYWGANNAVLVVTGDFQVAEMLKKLEATLGTWRTAEKAVPPIPKVEQASKAGVYMVQPEVIPNQGIVRIGHVGIMRDDPDYPAVDLMNYILGGGSFSSRITKVVRTDNGLAYSASSSYPGGILYPGAFGAFCQTKNSTVVFAAQLMLDLIEGMRAGQVTDADLAMAKKARLNAFPAMFPEIGAIVRNFADLEYNHRPMDFYDTYEAKYEKVTVAEIKRVAQKWLQPDKLIILVGGDIGECKAGADKSLPNQQTIDAMAAKFGGRTIDGLAKKYGDGAIHVVPLK